MRVLVNASTLVVGGGIQIGVSFIEIAARETNIEFLFAVSKGIFDGLPGSLQSDTRVRVIDPSPAGIFSGASSRRLLRELERTWCPQVVYSIGFPSYVRFKTKEIGRYTNPWEINTGPLPWEIVPGIQAKIKNQLGIWYRQFWARRADYIETQTEAARAGIAARIHFPENRIRVFPNSANPVFLDAHREMALGTEEKENLVFCLAAGYRHKNLDLIPQVAKAMLSKYGSSPIFILTLPEDSILWTEIAALARHLDIEQYILNAGKLNLAACVNYYRRARAVFLPTLLEVFSATYLEAMAMRVPIVTTDLEFAHDNCGKGAVYFKRRNADDAADKLHQLLTDDELYQNTVRAGIAQLNQYPTPEKKFQELFNWFNQITQS